MKTKLTAAEKWWNDCAEYEDTHIIAFASPSALAHARVLVQLDEARKALRRAKRKGARSRRKAPVA
ncbi:MAG: hypothetical protein ABMA01_13325 [Chthoniobacteraceae bacterium]